MSRKPIDQQQPTECRNAIWIAIRRLGTFTIEDLELAVNIGKQGIYDYLCGLNKAGYVESTTWDAGVPICKREKLTYTLVKDVGVDAPRVRRDGTPVTQGQSRQQMWNTLRILKTFSAADLAFNSSTPDCQVAESEAKGYISFLLKANYLRALSAGKPGHKPGTGTQARYILIPTMWTGPQPPQIQRTKQVYDPNLKRVVWSKVEGGAE